MLTLSTSCHGMPCIQVSDASVETLRTIKRVVTNNWSTSEAYRLKQPCSPFLQGYDENSGWVLVEFWLPDGIQEFIDHLNKVLADEGA